MNEIDKRDARIEELKKKVRGLNWSLDIAINARHAKNEALKGVLREIRDVVMNEPIGDAAYLACRNVKDIICETLAPDEGKTDETTSVPESFWNIERTPVCGICGDWIDIDCCPDCSEGGEG